MKLSVRLLNIKGLARQLLSMVIILSFAQVSKADRSTFPTEWARYQAEMNNFKMLRASLPPMDADCSQFLSLFEEMHTDIQDLQQQIFQLGGDGLNAQNVLPAARLYILDYFATVLAFQIPNQSAGGRRLLDPRRTRACPFPDQQKWNETAVRLTEALHNATASLFGSLGLVQMSQIEDLLASKIADREDIDETRFIGTIAATGLLSLFSWSVAPGVLYYLFGPLTSLARGVPLLTIRTSTIASQMYAFDYFNDHILFPENQLTEDRTLILSWKDYLNTLETIVRAPIDSPRLDYLLLTEVFGQISLRLRSILERGGTIPISPFTRDLKIRSELVQLTKGEAISHLEQAIDADFAYKMECNTGFWRGLSEWQCLTNLKRIYLSMNRGEIGSGPYAPTLMLGSRWQAWSDGNRRFVEIPSTAKPAEINRFIQFGSN